VLCFLFVLFVDILCLVSCLVLPVSLGSLFVIVPSVFSNVYFNQIRSVVNFKVNQVYNFNQVIIDFECTL
jgi:hypothetical protein